MFMCAHTRSVEMEAQIVIDAPAYFTGVLFFIVGRQCRLQTTRIGRVGSGEHVDSHGHIASQPM